MMASGRMQKTPLCLTESPFSSWSFVGIILVALVLRLPASFGQCKFLPTYPFAKPKVQSDQPEFAVGTSWEYECLPGYSKSSFFIICLKTSKWSDAWQYCKWYLPPPHIYHGNCNKRNKEFFAIGQNVSYSCEPGYSLIGANPMQCTSLGTWSHTSPKCEGISCDPPPAIKNGHTSYVSVPVPINTLVRYSCSPTYRLIGERNLFCISKDQVKGIWDKDAPICEHFNRKTTCPEPKVPGGHKSKISRPPYRHGDSVTFACNSNFTMKGNKTVWCRANTKWGPTPLPICESGNCGKPPVFDTMKIKGVPKSSYAIWEKVFYDCKPGYYYKLFSPYNTFCEPNSTWYPLDEACYKKSCPTPKVENGGAVDSQIGFEFDKEAHFYCDDGYYLKGQEILTCKLSGDQVHWDYALPTCEKILCQSPGKIKNGKHTNSWRNVFEFNELVTYSCDPSNGPDEYSLVGESKLICSGPGKWSSDPPQCKVVKCDYPVLKHGRPVSKIKEKFSYQDEILFQCLEGFYLNGSNPVFCGGNNTWEPEMPTCIKGFKPTHPTKPPVSRYPGYPNPRELPPIEEVVELDPGVIALIIFTILVAIAIICTCLYKLLRRGKKGNQNKSQQSFIWDQRIASHATQIQAETHTVFQL